MIKYQCSNCGQQFNGDNKYAGKKGKCHKCGSIVVIPEIPNKSVLKGQTNNTASGDFTESESPISQEKAELTENKPPKQSLLISVLGWAMIIVVVSSLMSIVIICSINEKAAHEKAVKEWDEMIEYQQQGKELPSDDFKKLIPEMKSFLDKMQPVKMELNTVKRNWELGINYYECKAAILRIGAACDGIADIPACSEARQLVQKAEYASDSYKKAFDYWKESIDYLAIEYKKVSKQSQGFRDEYAQKALKQSQEFNDYYNYLMEECEKRKIKRKN